MAQGDAAAGLELFFLQHILLLPNSSCHAMAWPVPSIFSSISQSSPAQPQPAETALSPPLSLNPSSDPIPGITHTMSVPSHESQVQTLQSTGAGRYTSTETDDDHVLLVLPRSHFAPEVTAPLFRPSSTSSAPTIAMSAPGIS